MWADRNQGEYICGQLHLMDECSCVHWEPSFDILNMMQLLIFLKNYFLTSKGHPKGQILAIMVHFKVFGHRVKNIQNIPKIYAYIIKVEDLLMQKMVL